MGGSFTVSGSSFKYLIKKNKGKIKRIFYNLSPAFAGFALFLVLKAGRASALRINQYLRHLIPPVFT
jgi:hypothetical protein